MLPLIGLCFLDTPAIQATYKEATPPDEPLILRSQIVRIKESESPGSKATVQVRGKALAFRPSVLFGCL